MNYEPDLTPKMRANLEAEIRAFYQKLTIAEIENDVERERNEKSYQQFVDENEGAESNEANPDQLADSNTFRWGRSLEYTTDMEMAVVEIRKLLSPMQWKVWELMGQQARTQTETAKLLNLNQSNVSRYYKTALNKIKEHFKVDMSEPCFDDLKDCYGCHETKTLAEYAPNNNLCKACWGDL